MVYETAETAEDIRRLLRSHPQIVVTAPRQSGKTTELLKYAEEKNKYGSFIVVCINKMMQEMIIRMHYGIVSRKGLTQSES